MNRQKTHAKARCLIERLRAVADESDAALPDNPIDSAAFELVTDEVRAAISHFEAFFPADQTVARNLKVITGGAK